MKRIIEELCNILCVNSNKQYCTIIYLMTICFDVVLGAQIIVTVFNKGVYSK